MAIPVKNVLGNPNVTEGSFQIAIEQLRESVIGSGKVYDSANTYMANDTCEYSGVMYYSKINNNIGNTPSIGANWGDYADLLLGVVHKTGNETKDGILTFTSSPIVPVPTLVNQAISMGNIIEKTGAGLGYGNGSGGTVTQLTSKGTSVTLNKPSGQITMNNASLAAGASVAFQLNNNLISTTDTIIAIIKWDMYGDTSKYLVTASCYSGSNVAIINVKNISASTLSDPIGIVFTVIKGATA